MGFGVGLGLGLASLSDDAVSTLVLPFLNRVYEHVQLRCQVLPHKRQKLSHTVRIAVTFRFRISVRVSHVRQQIIIINIK